jgi:hypothetical protein
LDGERNFRRSLQIVGNSLSQAEWPAVSNPKKVKFQNKIQFKKACTKYNELAVSDPGKGDKMGLTWPDQ